MFSKIRNSIVNLLLVILLLNTAVFAQAPTDPLKPTVRSTNFLTAQQLSAMMAPGSPTAATTTNSLPFPVTKNYPAFFVIPPDKRPQVLHQGNCNSCTAWSTVTALATVVANQPNPPISVQTIGEPNNFYLMAGKRCLGAFKGDTQQVGWWNYDATAAMKNKGIFLANILGGKTAIGSTEVAGSPDMWIKAGKEGAIGSKTALPPGIDKFDAMRSFLSTQGALTANLAVYADFNKYKSGIYNHKKFVDLVTSALEPHSSLPADAQQAMRTAKQKLAADLNKVDGGHSVTVIGYFTGGKITLRQALSILVAPGAAPLPGIDLNTQFDAPAFWIVQNSWGTDFGAAGIFLYEAGQDLGSCGWSPQSMCNLDDEMYYMLDPIVIKNGVQLGGSQSMLTGTWAMYNDKNVKYDKTATITHNGSNLTVDNGYGSVSNVQLNGATFTSSGLAAKVSNDGNAITWSNGFVWKKQ